MTVDLLVDVLNGAHLPILDTFDHRPVVEAGCGTAGLTAGGQILDVLLVDVRLGVGGLLTMAHQLLGEGSGNIQIDGQIRPGQTQLVVLKFIQPLEEFSCRNVAFYI